VADIYRVAAKQHPTVNAAASASATDTAPNNQRIVDLDYQSKFYIRIPYQDGLGIIRKTGALAEQHGVSIHVILQNPNKDTGAGAAVTSFCVTTDVCCVSAVAAMCAEIVQQDFSRGAPVYMPLQL
jgi:hypothetical protein